MRLFAGPNATPFVKDAFHAAIVEGRADAVNPASTGTKAAAVHRLTIAAGAEVRLRLRLTSVDEPGQGADPFADFDAIVARRRAEADAFFAARTGALAPAEQTIVRQAYAGLLWSKQFYYYDLQAWLEGDPACPPPPADAQAGPQRRHG